MVTDVSDAMRKKINTSVRLGLLGEKSPQDIIRELSKDKRFRRGVFKSVKDRAEVVTRTEVNRALNLSTQKRFEQWSQQVPEMRKYWLHTRDSRVRPSHSAVGAATNPTLGGKPIPAKSSFRVGGFAAMGPHSVTLPARETVNCRCVLVSVFDEEKKEAIKKETIKKELIKREKWLARRPTSTEHAFIFDKNDNLVFSKTGGISQVEFTHQELSKFGKNAVFTHNHPAGNSFSFEDIGMAIDWDMAEMRAVGSQFTYSMKRPKSGWPVLSANSPVFKSAFRDKLQQWKSHYVSQVENKKISLEDANMNIFNDIWKDMAKEFKLIYTRKGS
ncbi:MAG: phage minor head protein [bacterium]